MAGACFYHSLFFLNNAAQLYGQKKESGTPVGVLMV